MDKQNYQHLIDFLVSINNAHLIEKTGVADELVASVRLLQKKIAPLRQSNPRDHAYIVSSSKMTFMATVCAIGSTSDVMTVVDQIRVLEAGFTGDGLFANVQFPMFKPANHEVKFLAACYCLVMNHSGNTNETANDYLLAVSMMGFAGGESFKALKTHLQQVESARVGQSRIDAVDYLVREIHINPKFTNDAACTLASTGGVHRCLNLKIDPEQLLDRIMENIGSSRTMNSQLPRLHLFCSAINDHLFTSLMISRSRYIKNSEKMLELALNHRSGDQGASLIGSNGSLSSMRLTANQVIKIASLSAKSDSLMKQKLSSGAFEQEDIKAAVQRLDAGVQYQVISRLDLKSLYSSRELNLIGGKRLELELGM